VVLDLLQQRICVLFLLLPLAAACARSPADRDVTASRRASLEGDSRPCLIHRFGGESESRRFVSPRFVEEGDALLLSRYRGQGPPLRIELHSGLEGELPFEELAPRPVEHGSVRFDQYRGRLALRLSDGEEHEIVGSGAWAVATSPDSNWLCHHMGHLADSELFVTELLDGQSQPRTRSLGPGAQAAWRPATAELIFARPTGFGRDQSGGAIVTRSELYVVDLSDRAGEAVALTATPGLAEMEPSISPDGQRLSFSDWQSGIVEVLDLECLTRPADGGAP